jgi:hypothetical protein
MTSGSRGFHAVAFVALLGFGCRHENVVGESANAGSSGSGGNAGSIAPGDAGGAPAVNGCDRADWTFTASALCDTAACAGIPATQRDPAGAIDGDASTRYTSGRYQGSAGPESVTLMFGHAVTLAGINLFTSALGDGPASYAAEYATTGTDFVAFSPPVAGTGSDNLSISFPARAMTAVRVTQTGSKAWWWSIHELTLLGCAN